mmetsp:Transcript_52552/g.127295  ORF Transcript_52552/g.127295 Transcript_52552/m.127295 type:complete len:136 (+) Transcript_52552:563-970(+)
MLRSRNQDDDDYDGGCADSLEYLCVCGALWDCLLDDDDGYYPEEDNYSILNFDGGSSDNFGFGDDDNDRNNNNNSSIPPSVIFSFNSQDENKKHMPFQNRIRKWNQRRRQRKHERLKRRAEDRADGGSFPNIFCG